MPRIPLPLCLILRLPAPLSHAAGWAGSMPASASAAWAVFPRHPAPDARCSPGLHEPAAAYRAGRCVLSHRRFRQRPQVLQEGAFPGRQFPPLVGETGRNGSAVGQRDERSGESTKRDPRSPDSGELYSILATAAFLAQKHHLACEAADRRLNMEGALGFHFALAASLHAFAKEPAKAASHPANRRNALSRQR